MEDGQNIGIRSREVCSGKSKEMRDLRFCKARFSILSVAQTNACKETELLQNIVHKCYLWCGNGEEYYQNELCVPEKLLGYRSITQKLRAVHGIKVPRHLVHKIQFDLDPDGLQGRSLQNKRRRTKEPFTSRGPLWVLSADRHDMLCGYQNWMFPLGLYGFIDTFSRKLLSLTVVFSNSDSRVIGRFYLVSFTK